MFSIVEPNSWIQITHTPLPFLKYLLFDYFDLVGDLKVQKARQLVEWRDKGSSFKSLIKQQAKQRSVLWYAFFQCFESCWISESLKCILDFELGGCCINQPLAFWSTKGYLILPSFDTTLEVYLYLI